jgi:hypothetical protein
MNDIFKEKYLKYKQKYLELKKKKGGLVTQEVLINQFNQFNNPHRSMFFKLFNIHLTDNNQGPIPIEPFVQGSKKYLIVPMIDTTNRTSMIHKDHPHNTQLSYYALLHYMFKLAFDSTCTNDNFQDIMQQLNKIHKIYVIDIANLAGKERNFLEEARQKDFLYNQEDAKPMAAKAAIKAPAKASVVDTSVLPIEDSSFVFPYDKQPDDNLFDNTDIVNKIEKYRLKLLEYYKDKSDPDPDPDPENVDDIHFRKILKDAEEFKKYMTLMLSDKLDDGTPVPPVVPDPVSGAQLPAYPQNVVPNLKIALEAVIKHNEYCQQTLKKKNLYIVCARKYDPSFCQCENLLLEKLKDMYTYSPNLLVRDDPINRVDALHPQKNRNNNVRHSVYTTEFNFNIETKKKELNEETKLDMSNIVTVSTRINCPGYDANLYADDDFLFWTISIIISSFLNRINEGKLINYDLNTITNKIDTYNGKLYGQRTESLKKKKSSDKLKPEPKKESLQESDYPYTIKISPSMVLVSNDKQKLYDNSKDLKNLYSQLNDMLGCSTKKPNIWENIYINGLPNAYITNCIETLTQQLILYCTNHLNHDVHESFIFYPLQKNLYGHMLNPYFFDMKNMHGYLYPTVSILGLSGYHNINYDRHTYQIYEVIINGKNYPISNNMGNLGIYMPNNNSCYPNAYITDEHGRSTTNLCSNNQIDTIQNINLLIMNINDTCPPYEKFMTLIKYIQLTYFNSVSNDEKYSMSENTMKQFNRFQI